MYWTETPGIGGEIKRYPEDFVVEEIKDGKVWRVRHRLHEKIADFLSGFRKQKEFTHFTLVKRNWNTLDAVDKIASRLRATRMRFGYAGLKDRRAVSSQRVSAWKFSVKELKSLKIKDITLKNFECKKNKIKKGSLVGNRFTIRIRDVNKDAEETVRKFMKYEKIPNFFGSQRFNRNEDVGRAIIKGEHGTAREILMQKNNFQNNMKIRPEISRLCLNAYQSSVFNQMLEKFGWGSPKYLPLPGYNTKVDKSIEDEMSKLLKRDGITLKMLRRQRLKGDYRKSFFEPKWHFCKTSGNDLIVSFSLMKGSYATVLLDELMKRNK